MSLNLPKYNGKDNLVMGIICLPIALAINSIYFGKHYYLSGITFFIVTTLITALVFAINFITCGFVAVFLKYRFSGDENLVKKLAIMIVFFILISLLFLLILFRSYEILPLIEVNFKENRFAWAFLSMAIVNTFITFLMEGIDRYSAWQRNLSESKKLNNAYSQSQLNALKSQVNPHFLFNSLNSLSSLIMEDEDKAETFLNEMSKVYRYMLRKDEEQLVTLKTELAFLSSYMHLLEARFGTGLQITINVSEEDMERYVAPLILQTVIENAFSQNVVSRAEPLQINISSSEAGFMIINNVQPKIVTNDTDAEAGLDNLIKRYHLFGKAITVLESSTERKIIIPLFLEKEECWYEKFEMAKSKGILIHIFHTISFGNVPAHRVRGKDLART
jgi:sensor histidine kinase YesM